MDVFDLMPLAYDLSLKFIPLEVSTSVPLISFIEKPLQFRDIIHDSFVDWFKTPHFLSASATD